MNAESIRKLFEQVRQGKLTPDDAVNRLRHMPFEDLGFAKVDHHRSLRAGMPEVIFGEAKDTVAGRRDFRAAGETWRQRPRHARRQETVRRSQEESTRRRISRTGASDRAAARPNTYGKGIIAVVSAGTSDIPIAEEAVVTSELMGNDVEHFYDVGVAGIHRLLANREALTKARVVIVCAGMEGALPSVVGGLVGVPVIAVPTSVGYGASFKGLTALLGMLNSCASNVSVVNIDNGFGAGYVASLINRV